MATTVRVADGETLVTDGPFADTKDVFGGYYVIEADDLDARDRARRAGAGRADGRLRRDPSRAGVPALIERAFRDEWGRVLATLIGLLGDFDLAEEAVQDAFALAAERWPRDGCAARSAGVAGDRRAPARDRPAAAREGAGVEAARCSRSPSMGEEPMIADERLELLFTCCHPALAREAQVALTLRTLGGLSTEEIAAAFLVAPETMKRRLTRAKAKIRGAGHPVRRARGRGAAGAARGRARGRLPDLQRGLRRPRRAGRGGDPARRACSSALMPDEAEARGLLALMLLPRRAAGSRVVGRRARAAGRPGPRGCGTSRRSRRAGALLGCAAGRTGCRPRSPRCSSSRRSTGRGSSALYDALVRVRARRWSRSTAPSRWPRRAMWRARWRSSTRWGSTTTATCTRRAPSCCAGSGATARRERRTSARCALGPDGREAASSRAGSERSADIRLAA